MITPRLTAALVALAFASCQKPTAEIPPTDDAPTAPVSAPAATPAPRAASVSAPPAASVAAPPSATPAPELAPPGIFYLIAAVRMETDSGITGLPPGTGVKFLREGVYLSDAGEVALSPDQITNNLAIARRARDADRGKQTTAKMGGTEQSAELKAADAAKAAANAAKHQQDLADIDRKNLEARRNVLIGQEERLKAQLNALDERRAKENYNRVYKGRRITSTTPSEIKAVEAAIQTVREQIRALQ